MKGNGKWGGSVGQRHHTSAEDGISTAEEFSLNPVTTKLGPKWDDTASQKHQNQKKLRMPGGTLKTDTKYVALNKVQR